MLKTCCTCRTEKDESEYSPAEWGKSSSSRCRPCIRKKNKASVEKNPEGLVERNRNYYRDNRSNIRVAQRKRWENNKQQYSESAKAWREANKDVIREQRTLDKDRLSYQSWVARLRRVYNITPDDYNKMLEDQDYVCAICGTDDPGRVGGPDASRRVFAVDHCHTSGKVRGLLCHRCNQGLGLFYDNPDALRLAATYVHDCH